jgi:serine/threonine-protein kinase HipA
VAKLVELSNKILKERVNLSGIFSGTEDREVIEDIIRVGTSAGGARAKAILAWNPETNEFRSGQVDVKENFEHWLMKFDGVSNPLDGSLADSTGYGKIEYAYYLMAKETGIKMTDCRLHKEGGRSHFMTRRFDRTAKGGKLHMQSLGALAHYDYNQSASYSYEQAIQVVKRLKLPREDLEQLVLRAIFNVIGRNRDDHVKNIAFLMNRRGEWCLSPAFDVSYAWNPRSEWISKHQMSVNGKREGIKREDLITLAEIANIKKVAAIEMIDRVIDVVRNWPHFAKKADLEENRMEIIQNNLLINL